MGEEFILETSPRRTTKGIEMTDTREPCWHCGLMLHKEDLPEHFQSEHTRTVLITAALLERQPCQYCDLMLNKEDIAEHYQSAHMWSVLVGALQEIRDNLWHEHDTHRANGNIDLANQAWWRAGGVTDAIQAVCNYAIGEGAK